ncbi:hypothetical protein OIV83_001632 [Microbotryomycetes sp. JL201]|nr:hypothetical protein OIV83_001632 [Microbotryomycetes sp. JL201]
MASDEARVLVLYTGEPTRHLKHPTSIRNMVFVTHRWNHRHAQVERRRIHAACRVPRLELEVTSKVLTIAPQIVLNAQKSLVRIRRFHDPGQDSVFANSQSVAAYSAWSQNAASRASSGANTPAIDRSPTPIESDPTALTVQTTEGPRLLPSLVTPRTAQGKRIRYAIHEYEKLIDSSEVELRDWIRIATDIELNYQLYDGFVILHGTDTMAYSASALSFLLEDLGKTVILTGAQIPLSELFTDAIDNMLASLILAGHYAIPEVCVFFNNTLLRGNRSIKASSEELHAFSSPNLPPLATVGIGIDVRWTEVLRPGLRAFRAHKKLSSRVATLRIFPGITGEHIRAFFKADDVRGVVLASYGAGNAPRKPELLQAFKEATDRGVVIVNVSQCTTGAVAPEVYETGRALLAVGISGGADMTVECALAKLSYLLSKDLSALQIRRLLSQPLRGELTLTTPPQTHASPLQAGERLRGLFSRILECAPASSVKSPSGRPRSLSMTTASEGDARSTFNEGLLLPDEFQASWPATLKDEEIAEQAILPFLLGQASSRPDALLDNLLSSLANQSQATDSNGNNASDSTPIVVTALLNESATASMQTPLHLACLACQASNVGLLLAHGASVHVRDALSHSPLYYASRQTLNETEQDLTTRLNIVKQLKRCGAHFGETELDSGVVGLELLKSRKMRINGGTGCRGSTDGVQSQVARLGEQIWEEALGSKQVEQRALEAVQNLLQ